MDEAFVTAARERIRAGQALRIIGGGSKDFYGGPLQGELFPTREHAGIINYEPSELVVTVRAGTTLAELKSALAGRRQYLPFEPPAFGAATVGGMVASGLAGPRRMAVGSVRDYILGATLLDGQGRRLHFGGEVMKNVAGYDVSRLLAGSLGTLGIILDVSLKVLPLPVAEATLRFELDAGRARESCNRWVAQALPVSASCWFDQVLTVRLSGAQAAVDAALAQLGGERIDDDGALHFWEDLREQRHAFFAGDAPLWRLALPALAPTPSGCGALLEEWLGGQRWLRGEIDTAALQATAQALGGHLTLFRGGNRQPGVFAAPAPAVRALQQRLKRSFDPQGLFNPGRLHPEF
jgi:glycolate oxidase FAD binding subunit